MKTILALLFLSGFAFAQIINGVTNDQVNAAIAEDPAASRTAIGLVPSTSGGAGTIPKLDANSNLNLTTRTPISGIAGTTRSLILGNTSSEGGLCRLWWINNAGTDGASILFNDAHSGNPELQINGARIALCLEENGALQLGLSRSASSKQFAYFQRRGVATAGTPIVSSLPLYFVSSYHNGSSASDCTAPWLIATPTGSGTDADLLFGAVGTHPNEGGVDGTRTEGMRLTKNGLRLTLQDTTNSDAAVSRAFGDSRYAFAPKSSVLSADTAGVSSSVTPVDSGLSVALDQTGQWEITVWTAQTHSSAGGVRLKGAFSGTMTPLGGSIDRGSGGAVATRSSISGTSGPDGFNADITFSGTSSSNHMVRVIYNVTVAGTYKIQYAQNVSDGSATVLQKGSHIIARKL